MRKKFYASGFLYHLPSQQILLQQQTPTLPAIASPWFLFNNSYSEREEPNEIFKNIIFDLLHIKIDNIHPVYSYVNDNTNTYQTIIYSELQEFQDFSPKNGLTFCWFSFKDVLKLYASEQIKHDIVVGQRVIDAKRRKSEGKHTF